MMAIQGNLLAGTNADSTMKKGAQGPGPYGQEEDDEDQSEDEDDDEYGYDDSSDQDEEESSEGEVIAGGSANKAEMQNTSVEVVNDEGGVQPRKISNAGPATKQED